jgi:hypothetical protein
LQPYQQFRYLDVFAQAGAPAGDLTNVRAEFTNLTAANKKLIGFCTVQENTTFSADFRIAKSYGGTPQNAFVQGGNAFGVTAVLGTADNQPLAVLANNATAFRFIPDAASPILIGGSGANGVTPGAAGSVIGGGGAPGTQVTVAGLTFSCSASGCFNRVTDAFGTVGGGLGNQAGDNASSVTNSSYATVGGGFRNFAQDEGATIGGGYRGVASYYATVAGGWGNQATGDFSAVAGGDSNVASGLWSFAAGREAHADANYCALFGLWSTGLPFTCQGVSNLFRIGANHGLDVSYFSQVGGGGSRFIYIGDFYAGDTIRAWSGAHLTDGGAWTNASDRDNKENFAPIDEQEILARTVALPVMQWSYKAEPGIKRIGPVAQDFFAAFGLGTDDKGISTVDEGGVALAAIKGLHQVVEEKEARITALERAVADLQRALEALRLQH